MKVWILTCEYNDYDQHGEYFISAYARKPSAKTLSKELGLDLDYCKHITKVGGRLDGEYKWYWLRSVKV